MEKHKKDYKDGIITVTIPYVKKRELENGKLTIQGNRTYKVPVNVFADGIYKVLAKYPYTDMATSQRFESTKKIEKPEISLETILEQIFNLI